MNRYIPHDVELIERNGMVFMVHPFKRYDPITLAVIAVGASAGIGISQTLKEGKEAKKIAEARAAVDEQNAEAVRKASVEKARIKTEKGERLIARQKGIAAAAGIRINAGSPLVIEAETRASIAKDIGFDLETARVESAAFRHQAALEIAAGKIAVRKSKVSAWQQGLMAAGSIAFMGAQVPGAQTAPGTTPISPSTRAGFKFGRNFDI